MSVRNTITLAALGLLLAAAQPANASVIWTESINGDLTGNRLAPTSVAFVTGQNDIIGETGSTAGVTDRDYFTFTIPLGYSLSSLTVLKSVLTAGAATFLGLQAGNQVTVDPTAPVATPLLGYFLVSPAAVGTDILPALGTAVGAQGFKPPLGAGQFSVWIQDSNIAPSSYELRFEVTPVPEPGTVMLTLAGLATLRRVRRRRS